MTMAILGECENSRRHFRSLEASNLDHFWHRLSQTIHLALIFRRLGGEGRVEVRENRQNSEGVQLRPATEFASLVVLLCISRGFSFKRLKTPQKRRTRH